MGYHLVAFCGVGPQRKILLACRKKTHKGNARWDALCARWDALWSHFALWALNGKSYWHVEKRRTRATLDGTPFGSHFALWALWIESNSVPNHLLIFLAYKAHNGKSHWHVEKRCTRTKLDGTPVDRSLRCGPFVLKVIRCPTTFSFSLPIKHATANLIGMSKKDAQGQS